MMNNITQCFIDESGNTGGLGVKNSAFNFAEQPCYCLFGLLTSESQKGALEGFANNLKNKFNIKMPELKSKSIYESKPQFISELVDYMISNKIQYVCELMDKKYFISANLVNYFIVPFFLYEINDDSMAARVATASRLGDILPTSIYSAFLETTRIYSNQSLEDFFDLLIKELSNTQEHHFLQNVQKVKSLYYAHKSQSPDEALKQHLPLPDANTRGDLVHILPNYAALSNILGRLQIIQDLSDVGFLKIMHDEQAHFESIYKSVILTMQTTDTDGLIEGTFVSDKATFNLGDDMSITFVDSKTAPCVQIADLMAGFISRLWKDFSNNDFSKFNRHKEAALKLVASYSDPYGVNLVVPMQDGHSFLRKLAE